MRRLPGRVKWDADAVRDHLRGSTVVYSFAGLAVSTPLATTYAPSGSTGVLDAHGLTGAACDLDASEVSDSLSRRTPDVSPVTVG